MFKALFFAAKYFAARFFGGGGSSVVRVTHIGVWVLTKSQSATWTLPSTSMPTVIDFTLLSAVAQGQDVVIDLDGPADPTGYTLVVRAAYTRDGPPITVIGLTATAIGGDGNTIRVRLTAADTAGLRMTSLVGIETLYLEVWRTNSGDTQPLARLALPYYDPIRVPT